MLLDTIKEVKGFPCLSLRDKGNIKDKASIITQNNA